MQKGTLITIFTQRVFPENEISSAPDWRLLIDDYNKHHENDWRLSIGAYRLYENWSTETYFLYWSLSHKSLVIMDPWVNRNFQKETLRESGWLFHIQRRMKIPLTLSFYF